MSASRPQHDVAIHAPHAGGLYLPGAGYTTGGAELQTFLLAKELTRRGLRVCHILAPDERVPRESEGVRLELQAPPRDDDRFPKYSRSIFRTLHAADAAVYIQRSSGFETGVVGAFAKRYRRRFIFSSANDADWTGELPVGRLARMNYAVGLRLADAVVAQTETQRGLAKRKTWADLHVIRSFCQVAERSSAARDMFLWVGRLVPYKGPLEYVALAERLPEARFMMVAVPGVSAVEDDVTAKAAALDNLTVVGPQDRRELFDLFGRAVAMVNTSAFEGFPNTFMEAWARGTPALSLRVDPDAVITTHGLGFVADGSFDDLVAGARELWEQRDDGYAMREGLQAYVRSSHDPAFIGEQWVKLIRHLASR